MRKYNVAYRLNYSSLSVKHIIVYAFTKWDAYDKAVYEEIPKLEGEHPYSAYVESVEYKNGRTQLFNTYEDDPY